jgi:hypothetical protein
MKNEKKKAGKPIDPALLEKVLGERATINPWGLEEGEAIPQPKFGSFFHS